MQTYKDLEAMNAHAEAVQNAGREFYKNNQNFTACVKEACKRYNSAWLQDVFIMGRNLEFWGR